MSKPEKSPSEVCRACGRQMSGQDPNVVSRKWLAERIGKWIQVWCSGSARPMPGRLVRFDNYCFVIEAIDGRSRLVFKGPGLTVNDAEAPREQPIDGHRP